MNKEEYIAMTSDEMRVRLCQHIKTTYRTGKAAAKHWGVSSAMVSAVLTGKKNPNTAMLNDIGLKATRLIVYSELTG